jgi:hypothetical protein
MTEVPAEKCLLAWHILLMMEYLQKTSYLADILYKWPEYLRKTAYMSDKLYKWPD